MAAALPINFIWLFAACALICELECIETQDRAAVSSSAMSVEGDDSPGCKGCPVDAFPQGTAPERSAHRLHSPALTAVSLSFPPALCQAGIALSGLLRPRPPSADPPLDRLPALRI